MNYQSPRAIDLNEVTVLNRTYLRLLASDAAADGLLDDVPPEVGARLCSLDDSAMNRLANAPFLLFSLRETDSEYWDEIHGGAAGLSLFPAAVQGCSDRTCLIAAALGYVWQMARQNPYTLRLICCASLYWCELIAEQPLMDVINRATARNDLLELRASRNRALWQKLLSGGVDRRQRVRAAAHHSVLQTLLICPERNPGADWKSAACRTRVPTLSLEADD